MNFWDLNPDVNITHESVLLISDGNESGFDNPGNCFSMCKLKHLEESEGVINASKDNPKGYSVGFDHCQVLTLRARLLFGKWKEITSWCSGPDG